MRLETFSSHTSKPKPFRKNQCKSCPFLKTDKRLFMKPEDWRNMFDLLRSGYENICHTTDKHVCRGGRDWLLNEWCKKGLIAEPTEESFDEAMSAKDPEYQARRCDSI